MSKVDLSDFQKRFLLGSQGQTLFTQKEFEEALAQAKAEIMAVAIQTTKQAILIERQACAEMAFEYEAKLTGKEGDENFNSPLANDILNRISSQRQ